MNMLSELFPLQSRGLTEDQRIKAITGEYQFRSPYHKQKKMLPFIISGPSYRTGDYAEYNVDCTTVYYRGWDRREETSGYKLESLESQIEDGFLIKK